MGEREYYSVTLYGKHVYEFKECYTEEEVEIINSFFKDMLKNNIPAYDVPLITITKEY